MTTTTMTKKKKKKEKQAVIRGERRERISIAGMKYDERVPRVRDLC
jgi:hypothetical protein